MFAEWTLKKVPDITNYFCPSLCSQGESPLGPSLAANRLHTHTHPSKKVYLFRRYGRKVKKIRERVNLLSLKS